MCLQHPQQYYSVYETCFSFSFSFCKRSKIYSLSLSSIQIYVGIEPRFYILHFYSIIKMLPTKIIPQGKRTISPSLHDCYVPTIGEENHVIKNTLDLDLHHLPGWDLVQHWDEEFYSSTKVWSSPCLWAHQMFGDQYSIEYIKTRTSSSPPILEIAQSWA
jgi:hypothetical protein